MLKMQIKNVQLLRKLAKGLLRSPSSPFGFPSHETVKTIELPKSLILFSHRNCTGIFSQKWIKTTNLNLLWTKMYTSQIDNWQANSQKWTHRHKKCRQIYCKQKCTQVKTDHSQANSQKWTHRHKKCRQIYSGQKCTQVKTDHWQANFQRYL